MKVRGGTKGHHVLLQDALDSDATEAVHLVTPGALMKEVAKVHAMRSAGVHDFDAAKPMDLIHLLLGQSEPFTSLLMLQRPVLS